MAPDDPATSVASALTNEPAQILNVADVDDVEQGIPDVISGDVRVAASRSLVRALVEASHRVRLAGAEDPRHAPRGPPPLLWMYRRPLPAHAWSANAAQVRVARSTRSSISPEAQIRHH
jgi:hypothetical protein